MYEVLVKIINDVVSVRLNKIMCNKTHVIKANANSTVMWRKDLRIPTISLIEMSGTCTIFFHSSIAPVHLLDTQYSRNVQFSGQRQATQMDKRAFDVGLYKGSTKSLVKRNEGCKKDKNGKRRCRHLLFLKENAAR